MIGKIIGEKYRVIDKLGEGGFGCVYKVFDEHIGRTRAVKIYERGDLEAIKEAEKLRYLKAEGLPELTDIFTDEGKMCVCMEMAEGMNLDSFLSVNEGLERKERKKIAGKIVQILSFLHGREVPLCHGDLKPGNIVIDDNLNVKLIDFGSAHYINEEQRCVSGTPLYLSPEQKKGKLCIQSDIYAFGLLYFYIMTGCNPAILKGDYSEKTLKNYDLSFYDRQIILSCLKEDYYKRPQNGEVLERMLRKKEFVFENVLTFISTLLLIGGSGICAFGLEKIYYEKVSAPKTFLMMGILLLIISLIIEKKVLPDIRGIRYIKEYSVLLSEWSLGAILVFTSLSFFMFGNMDRLNVTLCKPSGENVCIKNGGTYFSKEDLIIVFPSDNNDKNYISYEGSDFEQVKEKENILNISKLSKGDKMLVKLKQTEDGKDFCEYGFTVVKE